MEAIENTEKIYYKQTKKYFNEVLADFFNKNYRSAVVMLYSVAICDLFLKLNELCNSYDDAEAKSILQSIADIRNGDDTSSKWEYELTKKMHDSGYISSKLYSDLRHLYDDRCFSAHPSMNDDFELIEITKETAVAHIKNIFNGLLIEPPNV